MGALLLLFLAGAIPLIFLYVLFTNPTAILKVIAGIIGILLIMGVGACVILGLFILVSGSGV